MIKYKSIKKLPPTMLFNLYEAVSWTKRVKNKKRHAALLAKVYSNSGLVFSAWDGKELIGVIRVLTDKYAHGVIFGLAVNPKYQRKSIGKKLVSLCTKKYPKIQWSVEVEKPARKIFNELGFKKSKNQYLKKGSCPV